MRIWWRRRDSGSAITILWNEIALGRDFQATRTVLHSVRVDYGVGKLARHQTREEVLWRTLVGDTCPGTRCPAIPDIGDQLRPWLRDHSGESIIELLDDVGQAITGASPNDHISPAHQDQMVHTKHSRHRSSAMLIRSGHASSYSVPHQDFSDLVLKLLNLAILFGLFQSQEFLCSCDSPKSHRTGCTTSMYVLAPHTSMVSCTARPWSKAPCRISRQSST